MIISASRRTDIPSYYSDWFFERIKSGYVLVRNPMNFNRISSLKLTTQLVDGIVFWTKNPIPMMDNLDLLHDYAYYFQFTLTPYDKDIESNLPSKTEVLIPAFRSLSKMLGRERVIWRYDPILLTERYTVDYHTKRFSEYCQALGDFTEKCTISFVDSYKNIQRNLTVASVTIPTYEQVLELTSSFSEAAHRAGIYLDACAEDYDLSAFGVKKAACIDRARFERIIGSPLEIGIDKNQRSSCGCAESVDIGVYSTCMNGCIYCYAKHSSSELARNHRAYNPHSPMLCGEVGADDVISVRPQKSNIKFQQTFFD